MTRTRIFALYGLILLLSLGASVPAFAYDDSLAFRGNPGGGVEVVVSGTSDGEGCRSEFMPPVDVTIGISTIEITSVDPGLLCFIPRSPVPYEVVARLGHLPGASYQVTWTQEPEQLSGVLAPTGVGQTFAAPAMSFWSLAALAALLVAFALRRAGRGWPRPGL